jgi:hypothetical protein
MEIALFAATERRSMTVADPFPLAVRRPEVDGYPEFPGADFPAARLFNPSSTAATGMK